MSALEPIGSISANSSLPAISPGQAGSQSGDTAVPLLRRALNAETQQAAQLLATVTPHLGQNIDMHA